MPDRQFRIGDRVSLSTRSPSHGYAYERTLTEAGTIVERHLRTWTIDFPSHHRFIAESSDLRLVSRQVSAEQTDNDEPTRRCDWCSNEVPESEISYDGRGAGICASCRDDAIQCENCGRWTNEFCECANYCPRCHNRYCTTYIHEYHTSCCHSSRNFLPDSHQDLYLGIELEMEAEGEIYGVAEALHPLSKDESIFLMERDGSLNDGLEIVSEPATLKYHKTNFGWDKIMSTAKSNHAISHDPGTCGLHIHFNISFFDHSDEAIDLNSAKLLYFFERFWAPLVKFSRRTQHQLECTAKQYGTYLNKASPKDSCDYAKGCGRYYAVNLSNENTIEIRIFRGTLDLETFYACLELVDFLARYIKKRSIHYIQRTTWAKVTKAIKAKDYPNLTKYLEAKEWLKCVS